MPTEVVETGEVEVFSIAKEEFGCPKKRLISERR
jgi:hypothetical protein